MQFIQINIKKKVEILNNKKLTLKNCSYLYYQSDYQLIIEYYDC